MPVRPKIKAIRHFPSWYTQPFHLITIGGQSRGHGNAEGTDIVMSYLEEPRDPLKAFMMNNPRAPGHQFEGDFLGPESTALIPYRDGRGDLSTAASAALRPLGQHIGGAFMYWPDLPVARRVFCATGEGGQNIDVINGDNPFVGFATPPEGINLFDRECRMYDRIIQHAADQGRGVVCPLTVHAQGEADVLDDTDADLWRTLTEEYLDAREAAIVARTGQTWMPLRCFDIMASQAVEATPLAGVTRVGKGHGINLRMVEMARANLNGRTFSTGCAYGFPYAGPANAFAGQTGVAHFSKEGVVRWAEDIAEDYCTILAGGWPNLLYAERFSLSGNLITIDCHVPVGSLTIDRTVLPAMTGTSLTGRLFVDGFEITSGNSVTIQRVLVSGTQITVQLSAAPTGTVTLGYAYNGLGAMGMTDPYTSRSDVNTAPSWGNIRDGRARASVLVSGAYRHNWLLPFNQRVL